MRFGRAAGDAKPKRCFIGSFRITSLSLAVLASWFSTAILLAQPTAGTALRFGSPNALVQIAHHTNFNGYPFTVSAWFRTTNGAAVVQGIASKYFDGTGNGWVLVVQNGRLRGFNYRSFANSAIDATSVITVADGFWHHAALTVEASGGKLFLDGVQIGASAWTGTPGGTTSTEPLLIGRYSHASYPSFSGDLDQITYWNRALGATELNYLKHRQLNGNEDGLVGLWEFNDGAGPTAADATGHGYTGGLSNNPVWIPSSAPVVFNSVAGTAVKLDGVNDFVTVAHSADLNAYPFSASVWFRTTNSAGVQGLVTKSVDTGNAWSLIVQAGKLRGFYYRTFGNFAVDATSAASVADGNWHHAALTVDASGGKLFLDGVIVGSSAWTGPQGPMTLTEPLQIGRYFNYPTPFLGVIDEVTIWNRALTGSEVVALKNLPLAGNEANLVAYWRLDDATGTTAADATGLGHTGILTNGAAWTGSTAYLGDGTSAIHTTLGVPQWSRRFAVQTIPAQRGFVASAPFWVRRLDDFGAAGGNTAVQVNLESALQATLAGAMPLVNNTTQFNLALTPFNAAVPQVGAGGIVSVPSLNVEPQAGTQLDSVNDSFQFSVTETYSVNSGPLLPAETLALAPTNLLHFNGHVFFGTIDTVVTNIGNLPPFGTLFAPTHLQSQLFINPNGAYLAAGPGVKFGGGVTFTVNLGAGGTATNVNGSFSLSAPDQFFEAAGIRYQLPGATLSASGLTATSLFAWLPTGFGMQTSTNDRSLRPYLTRSNIVLGPDLLPVTNNLVFTAASYNTNRLWFAEETKPFLIGATQIEWRIPQGEFYIPEAQALLFVREQDDRDLSAQAANLVNPLAADRISNDTYYRHVAAVPGAPIYVRPDPNGTARLTMQATLQENEYRPHFPYIARNFGGHVPVIGGALTITNDLINTDPAVSYLLLATNAPVPYARDCPPEGGCSGVATVGPQILPFTAPPGPLGLGEQQLSFTTDGGLLTYGTVPPTNLTWGFIGGVDYAQRTSDVQAGAYHIPGTFLRGDQATITAAQRPAALLLTGWGNQTNATYLERPGTSAYADGFANYAGLNFRAPAQGRSFIAEQNTGLYPLTPRSKYYVRAGGVSGIHEAASFPANLTLYGYAFSFQSYRLSYLDSANWESRTDGLVSLPHPSAFDVEFERMKFLCRGNLDSARLPANIGTKHLVYWNTDLQLLSLQFKPEAGDPCSLTKRYLVLGVETKLPFIPQALHAALAIKNNGNLANVNTRVLGVDSRFPVPANLSLQGPGGSFYPLTAGAEGYFNNWETPGKPAAGFYSLVGRVRVPFFRDVKVQLHVTPTGPTAAQIAIMGGWPAEEGSGANRGWNVAGQNYFTQAKFDPNHDAFPSEVAIGSYRNNLLDETYHPRAAQNWIDVAFFDYPLAWNSVLRQFAGFTEAQVILPVIDVDSRLKELTPGKVDLDFAQDIKLQLPRLKVLDFANDALNEINAPITTLSNSLRSALGATLNTSGLTSGFRSLQNALRENSEGFFRPVLEPALNPVVDNLYNALADELVISKANLLAKTPGIISASSNGLQTAIMGLNGTAGQVNSVLGQMSRTLTDVDDTIGLFLRMLEKDGSGNRHIVRTVIQKLSEDQGPALGFVANLGDGLVNGLLSGLEPTFAKIESELRELRSQFAGLRTQIGSASGDFNSALNAANHDSGTLLTFRQQAGVAVSNLLSAGVGPAGDYFTADPARAKREIRERLIVAFLGSPLPGSYQSSFRQFLYDKSFLLNQLTDVLFDQVNRSLRDGLSSQIAGAQDDLFQGMKGAGAMSGSLLSAKIRGAPTFEGDSLRKIHLDAEIKMNLPDEMTFMAYMDIKELNSATTPISCIPPGGPAAEVTLGAKEIPLSWLGVTSGGPLALNCEARWTLQSGAVIGIGGSFEVLGKVGFKGCSINDFGASLAFGATENYFAAKAGATVTILGIPVDFTAGIFAGQACSLDPLRFVDPEVEGVLIVNPSEFAGIYLAFGGGLSLSEILFGTSSCFLDISAQANYALYYQGGPRLGSIGGRQKFRVDVDLICIISASAEWATAMRLDSIGQLTLQGQARLCGKIGACPFCLKACKSLTVTGILNDGGIDYDVDF